MLKVSRQEPPICEIGERCYSGIDRFVWDGQQILWELRQSGTGDVQNPPGDSSSLRTCD